MFSWPEQFAWQASGPAKHGSGMLLLMVFWLLLVKVGREVGWVDPASDPTRRQHSANLYRGPDRRSAQKPRPRLVGYGRLVPSIG